MSNRYFVPVYANWEGNIKPTGLTSGAVAFYNPSFPPPDERPSKLNAIVPAYWMAIEAVTPLIYKSKYFVVLGEHNTIQDARVPSADVVMTVPEVQPHPAKDFSPFTRFGAVYTLFGLGLLLYVVHRL